MKRKRRKFKEDKNSTKGRVKIAAKNNANRLFWKFPEKVPPSAANKEIVFMA